MLLVMRLLSLLISRADWLLAACRVRLNTFVIAVQLHDIAQLHLRLESNNTRGRPRDLVRVLCCSSATFARLMITHSGVTKGDSGKVEDCNRVRLSATSAMHSEHFRRADLECTVWRRLQEAERR